MDKPDSFRAKPGEILDWLRTQFPEDVLQRLYWHIGDTAVVEAMRDVRIMAERNTPLTDPRKYGEMLAEAMEEMDPALGGGHYPSMFMCGQHTRCPGYSECKGHRGGS